MMRRRPSILLLLAALAVAGPSARAQQAKKPPNIPDLESLLGRLDVEVKRTNPDFVVYVPKARPELCDTGNEHFLVFDGPDGSLMAVWTQSSAENSASNPMGDQHIAFSRSADEGRTWSPPRVVAGPRKAGEGYMASWAYPLVSKKGRIFVLYSQHIGKFDSFFHHTGWLDGIYSDDAGATWSAPQRVPVARSIHDNPDPAMPPNMLCWQKPLRLGPDGKYLAGITRWTSYAAIPPSDPKDWRSADARVEFMRFENVDDAPEPRDLKIAWLASDDKALAVPYPGQERNSACQEPSIVKLPDGRLFVVMRTASGCPYWSVSSDLGESWTKPRPLLRRDGGEPIAQPLSPCPIYDVGGEAAGSGRYALFVHENTNPVRRPIYLAPGYFKAGADQPVWFGESRFFMDNTGVPVGKPGTNGKVDLSLYASSTVREGRAVLWYPDRKFFLLGRIIGPEWFQAP